MALPQRIPGLKWLTAIVGLYGVVWLSLEGAVGQVMLLATGLALLGAGYMTQRLLGGKLLDPSRWLLFSAALGALLGLGNGLLALILMAVKTGLHGHGPEFTAAEIEWLVSQIPLWILAGLIAGLGLGLLAMAFSRR
jgi:hypothetical protein